MTTPVTVADYIGDIKTHAYNPAGMQRVAVATFNAVHEGRIPIVDASNPFVFAMETSCANTSAMMEQAAALTRRQYPAAATTFEDLYLHMSNADYVNIFALPSQVKFYMVIHKNQLLNELVLDPLTGISKVTIPRNTVFYASGTPFSLQYPIDIRKLEHGALQIVYDVSRPTALQNITTNVIDYETIRLSNGEEYIQFGVDTQQFAIKSVTNSFNSTSGFFTTVPFEDQFYAARVYISNPDGTWREIQVTYTDQVYDPLVPTAALQVLDNKLLVHLPLVYITNGLISGQMRVDVYYTKGPMELQLGNYAPENFTADLVYYDVNDNSPYVTAMHNVTDVSPFAKDRTTGGRNALTFEELQARVIKNSVGPRNLPITPAQIQATLLDQGYTLVKNVDSLTGRMYWATKPLPAPVSATLVTSANANVATLVTQTGKAETFQGCFSHATGMTISSSALIKNQNGISSLMTRAAYGALVALPLADRTSTLNAGKYSYTPFHYVLDTTTDTFDVRPYYLDAPTVASRSFIQENPDTALQVSIGATFGVEKTAQGYRLTLQTTSNDAYKALADSEVFCQLGFTSPTQGQSAYLLGTQIERAEVKDERVFVFDINTVYDIDSDHALALAEFQTNNGAATAPRCALTQVFSVFFGTTNEAVVATPTTDIDNALGAFQIAAPCIGITHEHLTVAFGHWLSTLWNSFRSFTATLPFQVYESDVPKLYDKDVYQVDPVTGASFTYVNGVLSYNRLHKAGDPVLDSVGQQVWAHRQGEPKLDIFNRPLPLENYQTILNRSVEILTLDGVYQFANDPVTLDYVQQLMSALLTSLTRDLVDLNAESLERTSIYYYPAITQGHVTAIADNNQVVNLEAAQSLKISLYVDNQVFNNKTLTASLQSATIKTIGAFLAANATVAVSQLEEALSNVYGSDVLAVSAEGLGGADNYRVVTVTDESTRLSIRKVLKLLPNSQLAVQEDIAVVFTTHGFSAA